MQKQKKENIVKGNKIENVKLEYELESQRRNTKLKIQEKKDEINSTLKSISDLEKELSDLNIDIELNNKYGKESNFSNLISEMADKSSMKISPKKKTSGGLKTLGRSVLMMNSLRVIIKLKF